MVQGPLLYFLRCTLKHERIGDLSLLVLNAFLRHLAHESKCIIMKISFQPVFVFQLFFSSVRALGKQVRIVCVCVCVDWLWGGGGLSKGCYREQS